MLLQRAGRHEDALKIYVHDMGALDMATAYCDRVSKQQQERMHGMKMGSVGVNLSMGGHVGVSGRDGVAAGAGSLLSFDSEQDVYVMLLRTCLKQPATPSALPPASSS